MLSLIYVSTASMAFDAAQLAALRSEAARNNVRCGITGMLVYDGQRFMQLLEGADRTVHATMKRIRRDGRHSQIEILREEDAAERECPDWSMRAFTMPLREPGSAEEFARSLPEDMRGETRLLFTSFASMVGS